MQQEITFDETRRAREAAMQHPRSQLRTGGGTNGTITPLMGCQTVPNRDLEFEHPVCIAPY
jgi:hypothetical protein